MKEITVVVNDKMQQNYEYVLTDPMGRNFDPEFKPELTPKQMLLMGVFGGKYMTDCRNEFPMDWFEGVKICSEFHDPKLNFFGVNASQPLTVWRKKAGYTRMIREGGSSGIVGILWEEDMRTTKDKLKDG